MQGRWIPPAAFSHYSGFFRLLIIEDDVCRAHAAAALDASVLYNLVHVRRRADVVTDSKFKSIIIVPW